MSTLSDAAVAAVAAAVGLAWFVLYQWARQHQARIDDLMTRVARLEGRLGINNGGAKGNGNPPPS